MITHLDTIAHFINAKIIISKMSGWVQFTRFISHARSSIKSTSVNLDRVIVQDSTRSFIHP